MKKKPTAAEVEIQVTPMLDMAFQLLTFFIMTFNPAPSEGQFSMNLLPASPQAKPGEAISDANAPADPNVPATLRTMTTTIQATGDGSIGKVSIGDVEVDGLEQLKAQLQTILGDKSLPFEQALIQADPDLKYEELVKVIDIFSSLDLTKISFSQIEVGASGSLP